MLYQVAPDEPIERKKPAPGRLIFEKTYPNYTYTSMTAVVKDFFNDVAADAKSRSVAVPPVPTAACLAVAGVVTENQCRLTNLDWHIRGKELEEAFGITQVEIINDFVAQGYGLLTLGPQELDQLNDATPREGAPVACVGAGTGLGECFLTVGPSGEYDCYPSEGGHAEWAPRGQGSDETQLNLLKYLKIKYSGWNRISVERVVSGPGQATSLPPRGALCRNARSLARV